MSTETAIPHRHRFTREEYYALAEQGLFDRCRVERIEGEIVDMSPQMSRHAATVSLGAQALERAFGAGWLTRVQMLLALGQDSDPEPDLAVVRGSARDYVSAHPMRAVLVVEVAETTLPYDLGLKGRLYARSAIPEYWVVDTERARVVVHRNPQAKPDRGGIRIAIDDGDAPAYGEVRDYRAGETLSPLAVPGAAVAVSDLLP
jgi:Uma2 family endonuclease